MWKQIETEPGQPSHLPLEILHLVEDKLGYSKVYEACILDTDGSIIMTDDMWKLVCLQFKTPTN